MQLPGDKILGLARFFLSVGIPANAEDLFYQLDALASLENNRWAWLRFNLFSIFANSITQGICL